MKTYQEQRTVSKVARRIAQRRHNRSKLLFRQGPRLPLWSAVSAPYPAQREADQFGMTGIFQALARMRSTDNHKPSGKGRGRQLASKSGQVGCHIGRGGR